MLTWESRFTCKSKISLQKSTNLIKNFKPKIRTLPWFYAIPSFPVTILDKSVQGFVSYDQTDKQRLLL